MSQYEDAQGFAAIIIIIIIIIIVIIIAAGLLVRASTPLTSTPSPLHKHEARHMHVCMYACTRAASCTRTGAGAGSMAIDIVMNNL
jgi:flagellar basal body-associated protein FliL